MLRFETLLLRQLQKQQNRDEFCDTVLHAEGVSVPVHSCVLSAFSPRLYGSLSSMPVPMTGHRRQIELQAVDTCTLLSLVSLLYSGQLPENREQVLSAAQTLGFEIPQWQEEERLGGKVGRRKETEDTDQEIEKEVDARAWDDRMTRRMEENSRRKNVNIRDSGTQTECGGETDQRGAQIDLACSQPQSSQTVYLIDQSTCFTNQEPVSYIDHPDAALALQAGNPEKTMTMCNVLALAPETGDCHTVSDSACVAQICLFSIKNSLHQPSTSVIPHPQNNVLDQSLVLSTAEANAINNLKQFEGNIPGFISFFLDANESQNIGKREQSCAREGAEEKQVVKRTRARSTVGGPVREWVRWIEGVRGGRRQRCMVRRGLVARLSWQGKGGGRVGRLLQPRSTGKNPVRTSQQRNEALLEAGEARGRGRRRQRGKTDTVASSEGQKDPPPKRRPRGHPRVRRLPPAPRSFPTVTYTVDPKELDLLHTVAPMAAAQIEPIQPIDTLLDDIMNGLHCLPSAENHTNQYVTIASNDPSDSKAMYHNSHVPKSANPNQHLEGELGDILDHFLRNFDQHVGLDVGDETSQYKCNASTHQSDPSTDPEQLQLQNPLFYHQQPSSTLSTQPQFTSMLNTSVEEKTNSQNDQIHGSIMEKPTTDLKIVQPMENRRQTRSQSLKRSIEMALFSLPNPAKRRCKEKQSADNKRKKKRDDGECSEASVNKSGINILDKNNKDRATLALSEGTQKQASAGKRRQTGRRGSRKKKSVENRVDNRMTVFYEKDSPQKRITGNKGCGRTKNNFEEHHVEAEQLSNELHAGQSSVKRQIGGTCIEIASSAMEKVRMLLQLQDDDNEDESTNMSVEKNRGNKLENGTLSNHKSMSGPENSLQGHLGEMQEPENKARVIDNWEQDRVNSVVEGTPRQGEKRTASGVRQEKCREQIQLPSGGNQDSETALPTMKSSTKMYYWLGNLVSGSGVHLRQSEVLPPSTQNAMHKMADLTLDVGEPQLASAARLSQTQPCQELLSPHTSTEDLLRLAGSSVDEDEDVDVLEVSSPISELPFASILGVNLSIDKEEVDEDVEIDVLGLEPD